MSIVNYLKDTFKKPLFRPGITNQDIIRFKVLLRQTVQDWQRMFHFVSEGSSTEPNRVRILGALNKVKKNLDRKSYLTPPEYDRLQELFSHVVLAIDEMETNSESDETDYLSEDSSSSDCCAMDQNGDDQL